MNNNDKNLKPTGSNGLKPASKMTKRRNIGIALAAALIVIFSAVAIIAFNNGNNENMNSTSNQSTPNIENTDKIERPDEDLIDVLVVGVDANETLTDVIIVVRYNIKDGSVTMLQIPRDTYVGTEFPTGKINAVNGHPRANEEGLETLKNVINETMSIDIDYHVVFTIPMLRTIVDKMGGVTVDVPVPIVWSNGNRVEEGVQTLNGAQAEMFMRYRAGYAMGDIGRVNAQRLFFDGLFNKAKELGKLKCFGILTDVYSDIQTDMPLLKAVSFANAAFDLGSENIKYLILPGEGRNVDGLSVYVIYSDELEEMLNEEFKVEGEAPYVVDLPFPDADSGSSYNNDNESTQNNSWSNEEYNSSQTVEEEESYNESNSQTSTPSSSSSTPSSSSSQATSEPSSSVTEPSSSEETVEPPVSSNETASNSTANEVVEENE